MMVPFSNRYPATALFGVGIIAVMVVGCGARVPEGMVIVTGRVSMGGKPLHKGAVHFVPEDRRQSVAAPIKDGRFRATMRPKEYRIAVTADAQPEMVDEQTGKLIPPISLVPAKYTRVETSGLAATVAVDRRTLALDLGE